MMNTFTLNALAWVELKGYIIGTYVGVITILVLILMAICKLEVEEE